MSSGLEARRSYRDTKWLLSLLSRFLVLFGVGLVLYLMAEHVRSVLQRQNIATGFDFLWRPARFQIGETLIPFDPTNTYGRALVVALLNTLQVSILGCVLATLLGVIVGVARLSSNGLLKRTSAGYVEIFRNTPILLQLFFWYAAIQTLPPVRQSLSAFGTFFLSQRGVQLPAAQIDDPYQITLIALAALILFALLAGKVRSVAGAAVARALLFVPLAVWLFALAIGLLSASIESPQLLGFGFRGGTTISPEFLALLFGLVVYTASYIAEIVRGGIESIPMAQMEASESLGLTRYQTLRLVILPQALRIIVPPLVSEFLNLVKNSSLAVAIGYPDLVWAASTVMNQTGQAIEGVLVLTGVYLTLSLVTSFVLNRLNERGRNRAFAAGVQQRRASTPPMDGDLLTRLRKTLFSSPSQAILSLVVLALLVWVVIGLIKWGILDATFTGTGQDCRAGQGACWAYVWAKLNFFLFGFYPSEELWRPAIVLVLLVVTLAATMMPRFWGAQLVILWGLAAILILTLMGGGLGLTAIPTTSWGGLPVTLILAATALIVALPIGTLLAIGRNSTSPSAQMIATGWIEIIRGVPLISILFMANTLLPLFLPGGSEVDKLLRAQVAITVFASAYLAEAIRAGLRAVPNTQIEASNSLGLTQIQMLRHVVLPQAFRTALPGIVNTAIQVFKDTSLVAIIGVFDLLGTIRAAGSDPEWLGFEIEGYLFAALVYFVFCYAMSRYGRWLETRGPRRSAPEPAAMPAPQAVPVSA
jgi:general L-amino acid transport system permease protein